MSTRQRADRLLVERGLFDSRAKAQAAIAAGLVIANDVIVRRASEAIAVDASLRATPAYPYVSRGGVKLAAALDAFGIDPKGRLCLDVGASTGGFTDVLLCRSAARVYAVDVGYGQLHARLRSDPRVVIREKVNARLLSRAEVPEEVSLVVADLSFISLALVLPAVVPLAAPRSDFVLLVKPQFESERGEVGRGGIVRDEAVRARAVDRVVAAAKSLGLRPSGVIESPITGADGNVEFLAWFRAEPAKIQE